MSKSPEELYDDTKLAGRLWLKTEFERQKLLMADRFARYTLNSIKFFIVLFLGGTSMVFGLIALALFWGNEINSLPLGFFYTSLCTLGMMIILWLIVPRLLTNPALRVIIAEMFEEDEKED